MLPGPWCRKGETELGDIRTKGSPGRGGPGRGITAGSSTAMGGDTSWVCGEQLRQQMNEQEHRAGSMHGDGGWQG